MRPSLSLLVVAISEALRFSIVRMRIIGVINGGDLYLYGDYPIPVEYRPAEHEDLITNWRLLSERNPGAVRLLQARERDYSIKRTFTTLRW